MRHVFNTAEIAHKWAHQTQDNARNGSNFSFQGRALYSYSTVIAYLHAHKKRGELALISERRYSNTTAKHLGLARGAVQHLPHIDVPVVEPRYKRDHARNLQFFYAEAAEHLAKAQRAQKSYGVEWRASAAMHLLHEAQTYSAFFGIRRKVLAFPAAAWDAARARAVRIETPDPVRDAAKIRQRGQRAARLAAQVAEYRAQYATHADYMTQAWRAGGTMAAPEWWDSAPLAVRMELGGGYKGRWCSPDYTAPVLLRVKGEEIETSKGARIPLSHAPRIWRLVQRVMASGTAYQKNGHTEHAGEFAIDRVEADGTLRAGCHTILYGELELLARQLQLI